jgi:hypothetical protein
VDRRPPSALLRIVTAVWAAATTVQIAVWAVICVVNRQLVPPWWLWTAVLGGLLVVGVQRFAGRAR